MPESPPKRITRARAKAAEKEPNARAAGTTKAATSTKATRTTKRKTRADDVEDQVITIEVPTTIVDKPEPAKGTKGRPKKIVAVAIEETIVAESMPSQSSGPEPPKTTRGRTRKAAASKATQEEEPEKVETVKVKRVPRGRAATTTAAAAAAAASTTATAKVAKTAAPRKKVTFQDDLDKENIVPSPDGFKKPPSPKKPPQKATGLRAKPVRRPAAGRATRSSKRALAAEAEKAVEKDEVPPLSPKKAKQIPMAQPVSDEDELSSGKTPRKGFKNSLITNPTLAETGGKSVSKLDFSSSLVARRQDNISTADLLSPSKGFGLSLLGTPARRPPSPVKDMLKESSPKKAYLGSSILQPFLAAPATALNASLLQSPARRPTNSPVKKGMAFGSPKRFMPTATSSLRAAEVSSDTTELRAPIFSPPKNIPSPLRAIKSPERPTRVHRMTIDEQFEQEDVVQKPPTPLLSAIELDPDGKKAPVKPISLKYSAKPARNPTPSKTPPASPKHDDFAIRIDSNQAPELAIVGESGHVERSTTPPGLPTQTLNNAFHAKTPTSAGRVDKDSDSEDELQSTSQDYSPTPFSSRRASTKKFSPSLIPTPSAVPRTTKDTPIRNATEGSPFVRAAQTPSSVVCVQPAQIFSVTPLVSQFGNLTVAGSNKMPREQVQPQRKLFSPLIPKPSPNSTDQHVSPKSSFFDDAMLALEEREEAEEPAPTETSEASQEYGDENAIPIDPRLLAISQDPPVACTPARAFSGVSREVHTVQRVPLKPAAEELPTRSELRRSASLSGPSSLRKEFRPTKSDTVPSPICEDAILDKQSNTLAQGPYTPTKPALSPQRTPGTAGWSNMCSPARTPRRYVNPETLKGAVVHVDVHTAEGADASGIFLELLTQMGARCVKQWNWNPSSNVTTASDGFGIGGSDEGIKEVGPIGTPGTATPSGKIGITHVVFKDGGVRTLQKVRESMGVVLCVGVNWVLDCEREQKWLDEADYAVDLSTIPRGGHRRRKSMEPRALANINGNLVPCDSPAAKDAGRVSFSPTKEFLTFSSPASRRDTFTLPPPTTPQQQQQQETTTKGHYDDDDNMSLSPTTPYFLHPSEITQRTCPPKPRLLFPGVGEGKEKEDEAVKQRLLLARRKSLQWAPKVGSPLGRGVRFGV
ncbi:hypothetical protein FGG08_005706 [Glutinoglossum americanum]|uniref:BRCT domain-containing protein n=1 Tax=Glutinoglossum americanum TaxID=1670608 RepID=A0A9P8I2Q4_9PEZI|nr:hypothetical protein FGG08_005706 [Glutinoglossum americanum]